MDEDDPVASMEVVDPEMRQLLGMFDVPAFVRRGQDLEVAVGQLHNRLRLDREDMLEMVRLRLRQWAAGVERPGDAGPVGALWPAAGLIEPPPWGRAVASPRRRRGLVRDLIASVERFNRRWAARLDEVDLGPLNGMIERYNRYYLLEKECVLHSARLAARHFTPHPPLTRDDLRAAYPPLPVPAVSG